MPRSNPQLFKIMPKTSKNLPIHRKGVKNLKRPKISKKLKKVFPPSRRSRETLPPEPRRSRSRGRGCGRGRSIERLRSSSHRRAGTRGTCPTGLEPHSRLVPRPAVSHLDHTFDLCRFGQTMPYPSVYDQSNKSFFGEQLFDW